MQANIDHAELDKFEALAARWWDPEGDSGTLHHINPLRLNYITDRVALSGKKVLDVGCGGGVLSEAMTRAGARVTGVDAAEAPLKVARLHALESELEIDYRLTTAESVAATDPKAFDVVTCMELLEHVPDPERLVAACAKLLVPGGACFFATLNRTPAAFALGIVAAEHVLRLLPRGTHEYARLIRPSELAGWARKAGFEVTGLHGVSYNPFARSARLGDDLRVNYLMHCVHP